MHIYGWWRGQWACVNIYSHTGNHMLSIIMLLYTAYSQYIAFGVRTRSKTSVLELGQTWASPTLAWLYCTHTCVCLLACLLGLTTYHKSLPALILHIWCHALIQKGSRIAVEVVNHEQSIFSMATTRMETIRGLTSSVSRVTEVTAWQSVDAVCLCFLTHGSCHWTQISYDYSQMGATSSQWQKDGFHPSMTSPHAVA